MEKVKIEQGKAEDVRKKCAAEESVASSIQGEADGIRAECQTELNKALPILKAAEDALAELRPDDIREVRSFQKPAARVVLVLEAVLTLLGEKEVSWERAKLVMTRMDFIKDLQNYKKDGLTEKMIRSIQKYVNNSDFQPA
uniref:Dynein heavy chain 6, axonemal n=1 Tax=Lygus hesperus TaxID=30085 RepID=A0A0A9WLC5_LYGHE